jgi:hypothetical protein
VNNEFELGIFVSEHPGKPMFTAHVDNHELTGITMKLTPEVANKIYSELYSELVSIMAWRNHPVYQWGQRKIGKMP